MSADARVARAIQQVRGQQENLPAMPPEVATAIVATLRLLLSWDPAVMVEAGPHLDRVAALLDEAVEAASLAERNRVRRLLTRPGLNAIRAIQDGEIRQGCVVMDGATVREELRQAYLAIRDGKEAT